MSGRDPYPSPKLENCFTLSGFRLQQTKRHSKPTHIAQGEDPWNRLYYTATLGSIRRSVMHYEPQAPNDSLDIHLNSVHDQSKDFLRTKSQVLYQKESVYQDHRKKGNSVPEKESEEIRVWVDPQRGSIHSIK